MFGNKSHLHKWLGEAHSRFTYRQHHVTPKPPVRTVVHGVVDATHVSEVLGMSGKFGLRVLVQPRIYEEQIGVVAVFSDATHAHDLWTSLQTAGIPHAGVLGLRSGRCLVRAMPNQLQALRKHLIPHDARFVGVEGVCGKLRFRVHGVPLAYTAARFAASVRNALGWGCVGMSVTNVNK
eukprot:5186713-Amphidinium_carterae.1